MLCLLISIVQFKFSLIVVLNEWRVFFLLFCLCVNCDVYVELNFFFADDLLARSLNLAGS